MKTKFSLTIGSLVGLCNFSYSSFMRWKHRVDHGENPVAKPGPKKILPLDFKELQAEIGLLEHSHKRTRKTGILHLRYGACISRRELNQLIQEARHSTNRQSNHSQWHLSWRRPDLVWAIDGCELTSDLFKMHVQNMQDLYSTYKFKPLMTMKMPCGNEVANHLSFCFKEFDPPLFFKRDNAGNFNSHEIDALLEEEMVIPINSPGYYAQYNGAIEHAQGEFKAYVRHRKHKASTPKETVLLGELVSHDLNHKPRRKLKGENACQSYFNGDRLRYNKRKRKEVFDWIKDLSFEISVKTGMDKIDPCAWRIACRKWMEKNDMITIQKNRNVLPNFSLNLCHN